LNINGCKKLFGIDYNESYSPVAAWDNFVGITNIGKILRLLLVLLHTALFTKAMESEINDHNKKKHWRVIRRSLIPKGARVLPSVWALNGKKI
jgi:hypothetical protein